MAHIAINARHPIGRIQPRLYGSFLEHLGRCIYGGIWEEGSALSDEQGYRRDVREAVRAIGVTQLRYPGGNFVSNYHWRDGVGPREDRPVRRELAWGGVETNRFGTHEFMEYCAQVDAEPYMCVNLGTGAPEEAADWLEYCTSRRPTTIARQRAANGHPRPFDVRLWGLGNEMYGTWQIGQRTARDYALVARETAAGAPARGPGRPGPDRPGPGQAHRHRHRRVERVVSVDPPRGRRGRRVGRRGPTSIGTVSYAKDSLLNKVIISPKSARLT